MERTDDLTEQLSIEAVGDREPLNDRLSVRITRPLRRSALVLGDCPLTMSNYLSRQYRVVDFEAEPNFSDIRITALCDVSIESIPDAVLKGLPGWLERGTLYLGGRKKAFGLGGWVGSEIENLSPFSFEPEEEGRGTIHMLVAIDSSGSMSVAGGGVGMDKLSAVVPQWMAGLRDEDKVSIASFDADLKVLMRRVSANVIRQQGFMSPSDSGGGTRFGPVVDWVVSESLPKMRAYLLVVSDGQFADFENWRNQADELRNAGVKVLGVSLGDDSAHARLCELARRTEGQCFKETHRLSQGLCRRRFCQSRER